MHFSVWIDSLWWHLCDVIELTVMNWHKLAWRSWICNVHELCLCMNWVLPIKTVYVKYKKTYQKNVTKEFLIWIKVNIKRYCPHKFIALGLPPFTILLDVRVIISIHKWTVFVSRYSKNFLKMGIHKDDPRSQTKKCTRYAFPPFLSTLTG